MELKLLLGLCGRARHGKDFTASVIHGWFEEQGYHVFTSSISEEVLREGQDRGIIRQGITRADCTRVELDALVALGHEGRAIDEYHWLFRLEARIVALKVDIAVIPGIRFPNEIDWLRSFNGTIARVKRYNVDGSLYISPDRDPNDPMETCIERVVADYEISAATGQESWLKNQARGLANELRLNRLLRG